MHIMFLQLDQFTLFRSPQKIKRSNITLHKQSVMTMFIFNASQCKALAQRYLNHSGGNFEFFCPTEATRCTDGAEIWRGGFGRLLHAKFHPHRCKEGGMGPKKLKICPDFFKILEYKRPAETHPSHDFRPNRLGTRTIGLFLHLSIHPVFVTKILRVIVFLNG